MLLNGEWHTIERQKDVMKKKGNVIKEKNQIGKIVLPYPAQLLIQEALLML